LRAAELTSRRRVAVLATACLAVFAIDLDTTVVNVAAPRAGAAWAGYRGEHQAPFVIKDFYDERGGARAPLPG
jgi:hypothetical protein